MGKPETVRTLAAAFLATTLALGSMPEAYGQAAPAPGGGTNTGIATGSGGGLMDTPTPTDYLTRSIVRNINAASAECAAYEPVYRIDCLRQRLLDIARRIPKGKAYDEARQIVQRAAGRLGRIQAANLDAKAPRMRSRGNARMKETKTYTAVRKRNLEKAMEAARQVIEEAQTQLLRASENSEKRASHYRDIAAAVGSTKVLLRSI
ncbi:hypothetical protein [Shinella zoogloeoides]|uniref:hypothetical protein n=1 Tax=Shinella zoogloeoides TaxID=352475 RepID=UPI00299D0981|nr:hypothetical protein [Shinella zoogloeoides]WPE20219.1 hypothetical protein ShzoTeo12_14030 [Shinella zoogloeoides]